MTANKLLKANVQKLLELRGKTREQLAQAVGNSTNWIDKIFRYDERTFPVKYYAPIAKFFGVEVYQLFQPGIAEHSERRSGADRRQLPDRRFSQAVLSERPLDTDIIHVMRAISLLGRRQVLDMALDVLNDELQSRRTIANEPGEPNHSDERPQRVRARRRSGESG
jgi:transcriptional regulator with XRE-family HTH domain